MEPNNSAGLAVYESIAAITAEFAKTGIEKKKKAGGGLNYAFRGIDDVYASLSSFLGNEKLTILPRVVGRTSHDYENKNGTRMVNVVLDVEYDFVSAKDGSRHTVRTVGEAMDSSDKACNKAMSAAYKYMALMTFCIPTEGDNDTENSNPQVSYQQPQKPVPVTASPEERKRNAGLYMARDLKITRSTAEFKEFEAKVVEAGDNWVDVALQAEQAGVTTFAGLMQYINGESAGSQFDTATFPHGDSD